jgi:hypothetical protein
MKKCDALRNNRPKETNRGRSAYRHTMIEHFKSLPVTASFLDIVEFKKTSPPRLASQLISVPNGTIPGFDT